MACAARIASHHRCNGHLEVPLDSREQPRVPLSIVPVLPQENPAALENRIELWLQDMQPRNAAEAELVSQAARLSWMIERADRLEKAHLAHRVRKAELRGGKTSLRQFQRAQELGRKLLYDARPVGKGGTESLPPPWVDQPAVFVRGLEETEDGCRWLLERWLEFRTLLDRKVKWSLTDFFRFVRLQGKHAVEAVNDPALNALLLAWDVIVPDLGKTFWKASRGWVPDRDPGLNAAMEWREIADRPSNKDQAWALIRAEVDERINRLAAVLGEHARIAAADVADQAALDLSPGIQRHRRNRLAMGRELLRILDTLRKLTGAKQTARETKMANGQGNMTVGRHKATNGECQGAECGRDDLPAQDAGPVIAQEEFAKNGILSREGNGRPDSNGLSQNGHVALPRRAPFPEGDEYRGAGHARGSGLNPR